MGSCGGEVALFSTMNKKGGAGHAHSKYNGLRQTLMLFVHSPRSDELNTVEGAIVERRQVLASRSNIDSRGPAAPLILLFREPAAPGFEPQSSTCPASLARGRAAPEPLNKTPISVSNSASGGPVLAACGLPPTASNHSCAPVVVVGVSHRGRGQLLGGDSVEPKPRPEKPLG